jgi:hypothetical protein
VFENYLQTEDYFPQLPAILEAYRSVTERGLMPRESTLISKQIRDNTMFFHVL